MTFDEARKAYPHFGLAIYALEPGKPVTLEIYNTDGAIFSFAGPTEQDVLDQAFPPEPEPEPQIDVFD